MPDEAPRQRPRWRTAAEVLVLAAAVAACYANGLAVPFQFDDSVHIAVNPGLGSWAPGPVDPPSRRIAYLSFKLDHRLHGLDPAGFHLTNLAVHVLATLAVYALARLLLARAGRSAAPGARVDAAPAAFAGALLWAVHPVQTQAVTYVVQRIASLAALFYVGALALYVVARDGRGTRRALAYAAALAAGLLATFTKEIAFTLPLAIVLVEAAFFDGPRLRRLAIVAPFLALLPIVPWMYLAPHRAAEGLLQGGDAATRLSQLSRLDYLATEARVVVTYLRLLVLPIRQNLDYDYPIEHGLGSAPVLLSGAFLLAVLAGGGWLLARGRAPGGRVAGFGIVLFFLALSVESSVIPVNDVIFEHRLYLPSVGAALAVAGLLAEVIDRRPAVAPAAWAVVAAAALALGAAAFARNRVWRDPVTLWRDVAEKSPNKARGHYNLGNALREAGDLAGAEREWIRTVEIQPMHSGAENQLGSLALVRGDLAAAEVHLRRALAPPWAVADANYNLALVLEATGRGAEALAFYRAFVERAPPDRAPVVAEVRARFGWR